MDSKTNPGPKRPAPLEPAGAGAGASAGASVGVNTMLPVASILRMVVVVGKLLVVVLYAAPHVIARRH